MTKPTPIYLDNHSTTAVDPRVLETMLPYFLTDSGNTGSIIHTFGTRAKEAVERARHSIATNIGAQEREIVFTSGATESNNLALRGVSKRLSQRGNHIVSVNTEHKATLEPLESLGREGFQISILDVARRDTLIPGIVSAEQVADAITDQTILVSVMLANNEIGVIQPLREMGEVCRARGVLLHCDATQGVGRIPVNVDELNLDLMSFSAHKIYGPKGIGALYVRCGNPRVRLSAQIEGGGQEGRRRSGTLNVPGIVGFATALELCIEELDSEMARLTDLRNRLFAGLSKHHPEMFLNGPSIETAPDEKIRSDSQRMGTDPRRQPIRLPGNLNCCFSQFDGESVMLKAPMVAFSSGSACSASSPEPSHVLQALGLSEGNTRASLRFGLGRFNTIQEIDSTVEAITHATDQLSAMQNKSH